uniref:Apple domain-containing protein n=1 Tax=Parastrongyloides trichosuri TaxID=131310 RepID=A0A0N4ZJM0_PARTI
MSPRGICSVSKANSIRILCTANAKIWKGTNFVYPLKEIIRELNEVIDNGLDIQIGGKTENVAVRFVTFCSDNLELNQCMGFNADFAIKNSDTCRLCTTKNSEFISITKESQCALHTSLRESVLNV